MLLQEPGTEGFGIYHGGSDVFCHYLGTANFHLFLVFIVLNIYNKYLEWKYL